MMTKEKIIMTEKLSKEDRINSIIASAVEVFLEKGYEAATMEAIALKAGISKGGLYHHFRNKDEVLVYANQVFTAPIEEMLSRLSQSSSVAEGLELYITEYIRHWQQHTNELRFYFLSMNKAFQDKTLITVYQDYTSQIRSFFEGVFDAGVQNGEFAPLDSQQMAIGFISAIDGSLAYLLIDETINNELIINSLKRLFIENLKS